MAATILSLALFLASVVYYSASLVGAFPHLFAIAQPLPFLFGPLVYLYAVTAGDRDWRLHPRDAWHALPAALVLVFSIPIFLLSGAEKVAMYDAIRGGNGPGLVTMIDPLRLLSGGAYTVATFVGCSGIVRWWRTTTPPSIGSTSRGCDSWSSRRLASGSLPSRWSLPEN